MFGYEWLSIGDYLIVYCKTGHRLDMSKQSQIGYAMRCVSTPTGPVWRNPNHEGGVEHRSEIKCRLIRTGERYLNMLHYSS